MAKGITTANVLELYESGQRDFRAYRIVSPKPDFSGRDLSGADFSSLDLAGANLSEASLISARFVQANLFAADLSGAELTSAYLTSANLESARLHEANLTTARLDQANLAAADLTFADLSGAHLQAANLRGALMESTNLVAAVLDGAHLEFALLSHANVTGAQFHRTHFRDTLFIDVALDTLADADVCHEGPSHVNFGTIVRSLARGRLKGFLRETGMPDVFVEYMIDCARSLEPDMVFSLLQSTFISYGGPDEAFARKLNAALAERGVNTFFFGDHAVPGERLHRIMRKGVNDYDRVILVCSQASLNRPGLMNELQETLAREARDGGQSYLLPIRLDDYVIDGWRPVDPGIAQTVRDRVIADFRAHEHTERFHQQLARLVAALKKPDAT